ncbi:MAG: hypothetical protein ABSC42_17680 [Tepidisphaeraceae bacterium]
MLFSFVVMAPFSLLSGLTAPLSSMPLDVLPSTGMTSVFTR